MLEDSKAAWKALVMEALGDIARPLGLDQVEEVATGKPPKAEQGDIAFPMFSYAKAFRMAPAKIASEVMARLKEKSDLPSGELIVLGPYLNVKLDSGELARKVHEEILSKGDDYGTCATTAWAWQSPPCSRARAPLCARSI